MKGFSYLVKPLANVLVFGNLLDTSSKLSVKKEKAGKITRNQYQYSEGL